MQVLSAPSSARTFWFVNTAGAVPGEASAARNIARSRSLREPGFLVIVAPFSNRGPSGVTGGPVLLGRFPTDYFGAVASRSKSVPPINKSQAVGEATKKRSAL